ncbi:MAG: PrpF domain-containing protein [Candidatus Onthomonas sp.]|nr:PrpF domain-containing protein [Candidatus Onthomonas sp.]
MYQEMTGSRCAIVCDDTSKGIFIKANDLPSNSVLRDRVILSIFGSPKVRQIDGLGGADVIDQQTGNHRSFFP